MIFCMHTLLGRFRDGRGTQVRGPMGGGVTSCGNKFYDFLAEIIPTLYNSESTLHSNQAPPYGSDCRAYVIDVKEIWEDLIHLLQRCTKLHHYWTEVMGTLNMVFQTKLTLDPKYGLLSILNNIILEESTRVAFTHALFQARRVFLLQWKKTAPLPPSNR